MVTYGVHVEVKIFPLLPINMCIVEENTSGTQGEPQSWSGRLSFARIKPQSLSFPGRSLVTTLIEVFLCCWCWK